MYETRHPQLGLSVLDIDMISCFLLMQRNETLGEIEVLVEQEKWLEFGESTMLPVLRQRIELLKSLTQRLGPLREALRHECGGLGVADPQNCLQLSLFEQQH